MEILSGPFTFSLFNVMANNLAVSEGATLFSSAPPFCIGMESGQP